MPCQYKYIQANTITGALRTLGLSPYSMNLPIYGELMALRSQILAEVLPATPRISLLLRTIIGLSPGTVRVWLDTERGWMAEGRKAPGATPVYHQVTAAEALGLMQEHPNPDLAHRMMEPDPYVGE